MKDYSFLAEQKVYTHNDVFTIVVCMILIAIIYKVTKAIIKYKEEKQAVKIVYVPKKVHSYVMNRDNCDITLPRNYNKNYYKFGDIICLVDIKDVNTPVNELKLNIFHKIIKSCPNGNSVFLELERKEDIKISY